jgi:hypothetical protein
LGLSRWYFDLRCLKKTHYLVDDRGRPAESRESKVEYDNAQCLHLINNLPDKSSSAAIPKINITTEQSNITDSTSNQVISATKATEENTNNVVTSSFFNKKTLAIGIIGLVVGSLLAALTIFVPPIALFLGVALGKTAATLIILGSGTLGGLIFTAIAGLAERNRDTNKKTLTQPPTENKKSTQNAALASLKSKVAPTSTNDNKNTVPAALANASVSSCKATLLSNEVSVSSNITVHENKKSLVI